MIKAFVFDIDGTLVDTKQFHIDAWTRALKEVGIDAPAAAIQSQLGRRANELAEFLLPEEKRDSSAQVVERKRTIFREYYPSIKAIAMTKELFDFLHSRGIKIALATSATRVDTEFYIDILTVRDCIGGLVTAEDITRSKPDPEVFVKAAAQLGVAPGEAIAVGDSPHDIEAAIAAGMVAIGVLTGGFSEDELRAARAHRVYADIQDLYSHIQQLLPK